LECGSLLPFWRSEACFPRITEFPPDRLRLGESGGMPPHSKTSSKLGNELLRQDTSLVGLNLYESLASKWLRLALAHEFSIT
jgi:hypothetical protein